MARNPHASYEASDHQRMPIIPKFTDYIANNLTTTVAGFALDARQGKILNETKLNIANVVNNLTTTVAGYALDARQGKALDDKITSLNNSLGSGKFHYKHLDVGGNNSSVRLTRASSGHIVVLIFGYRANVILGVIVHTPISVIYQSFGQDAFTASFVSNVAFDITFSSVWPQFDYISSVDYSITII